MKTIILIGPANTCIPPKGWGACESVIWDYYCNLKLSYNAIFLSIADHTTLVHECNSKNPDIVHILYDDFIGIANKLNCKKIFYTSHYAYITHPNFQFQSAGYFNSYFKISIELQNYITLNALSKEVADVYIKYGFNKSKVNIIRNGAREDLFEFTNTPKFADRSIYVAKIELRKAQYKYQSISNIDFAGNYHNSSFDIRNKNYLGEWTKDVLYKNLTEYGNLILLSDGEADPLVVKEALIAGLGVVVSECAAANLDRSKRFIDVIPNDKLDDTEYVKQIIEKNREICKQERENIRNYGIETFSWKNIIHDYIEIINS